MTELESEAQPLQIVATMGTRETAVSSSTHAQVFPSINFKKDLWIINSGELQLIRRVGKGSFGIVYQALWAQADTEVAVKELTEEDVADPDHAQRDFQAEVEVMMNLSHPNIVKIYGFCAQPMRLVMEYCDRDSLFNAIKIYANSPSFTWLLRLSIAKQIAQGMYYMHSRNVLHRDLKSPNVLLTRDWTVKISDFGFARQCRSDVASTLSKGTNPIWTDPELLRQLAKPCDKATDVYSFGIILYELLTLQQPAQDLQEHRGGNIVLYCDLVLFGNDIRNHCDFSAHLLPGGVMTPTTHHYIQLLLACLEPDSTHRPTFSDILPHLRVLMDAEAGNAGAAASIPPPSTSADNTLESFEDPAVVQEAAPTPASSSIPEPDTPFRLATYHSTEALDSMDTDEAAPTSHTESDVDSDVDMDYEDMDTDDEVVLGTAAQAYGRLGIAVGYQQPQETAVHSPATARADGEAGRSGEGVHDVDAYGRPQNSLYELDSLAVGVSQAYGDGAATSDAYGRSQNSLHELESLSALARRPYLEAYDGDGTYAAGVAHHDHQLMTTAVGDRMQEGDSTQHSDPLNAASSTQHLSASRAQPQQGDLRDGVAADSIGDDRLQMGVVHVGHVDPRGSASMLLISTPRRSSVQLVSQEHQQHHDSPFAQHPPLPRDSDAYLAPGSSAAILHHDRTTDGPSRSATTQSQSSVSQPRHNTADATSQSRRSTPGATLHESQGMVHDVGSGSHGAHADMQQSQPLVQLQSASFPGAAPGSRAGEAVIAVDPRSPVLLSQHDSHDAPAGSHVHDLGNPASPSGTANTGADTAAAAGQTQPEQLQSQLGQIQSQRQQNHSKPEQSHSAQEQIQSEPEQIQREQEQIQSQPEQIQSRPQSACSADSHPAVPLWGATQMHHIVGLSSSAVYSAMYSAAKEGTCSSASESSVALRKLDEGQGVPAKASGIDRHWRTTSHVRSLLSRCAAFGDTLWRSTAASAVLTC